MDFPAHRFVLFGILSLLLGCLVGCKSSDYTSSKEEKTAFSKPVAVKGRAQSNAFSTPVKSRGKKSRKKKGPHPTFSTKVSKSERGHLSDAFSREKGSRERSQMKDHFSKEVAKEERQKKRTSDPFSSEVTRKKRSEKDAFSSKAPEEREMDPEKDRYLSTPKREKSAKKGSPRFTEQKWNWLAKKVKKGKKKKKKGPESSEFAYSPRKRDKERAKVRSPEFGLFKPQVMNKYKR